jgi:primosomal protein N' (replication factor Y)
VEESAKTAAELLRTAVECDKLPAEILGPAPAPLSLLRNRYRWQMLLKGNKLEILHRLCDQLIGDKQLLCRRSVRIGIDVDPENML